MNFVHGKGVEPLRLSAAEPKDDASVATDFPAVFEDIARALRLSTEAGRWRLAKRLVELAQSVNSRGRQ